jgi:D-inositol-3-phosphate glycosyltransferase
MFLFHTIPYVRNKDGFNISDQYGAWVGHQDLIEAVLRYSSVEGIHFFLPFKRHSDDELAHGLEELRKRFPSHEIETKRMIDLHDHAQKYRYALADDFEMFESLALSRYNGRECLFPLCTILHTIPQYTALMGYLSFMLLAEPFDAVVTSSEAGCRALTAICQEVEEFIRSRLRIDPLPKPDFARIPMGINDEFLCPGDSVEARAALNLPLDTTNILYLGRLSESFKADLEPLLRVFVRLVDKYSNLRLIIAGQDSRSNYAQVVRLLATRLGIGERVIIRTNFPFSQKPLFYRACDIFVSPVDNIQETFGLSILEAMACGVPVVASDWSGYRDLVVHEETGFLIRTIWNAAASRLIELVAPMQNSTTAGHYLAQQTIVDVEDLHRSLKLLLDSQELRSRFGEKGRQRVRSNFSWPVVIKQYENLWRRQWLELDRRERRIQLHLPLNYNKEFGHFATTFLDREVALKTTEYTSSASEFDGVVFPYPIRLIEVQRVIARCQTEPQSIAELARSGDETTLNVVTWLWKKGYLEGA